MEIGQLARDPEVLSWLIPVICIVVGGAFYLLLTEFTKAAKPRYRSPRPYVAGGFSRSPRKFEQFEADYGTTEIKSPPPVNGRPTSDYVERLRHVMGASFRKKRVMNKSEFRVFRIVEEELSAVRKGHRIMSQTCLGEILDSDNPLAFASINAKRVDILVIQPNGEPLAVFEFQGK